MLLSWNEKKKKQQLVFLISGSKLNRKQIKKIYSNNFKEYKLYKGRTKKYVYRDSDITMISILCQLVITGRNKVEELVI